MPKSHSALKASWQQEAMDRLNQALATGTPPVTPDSPDTSGPQVFGVTLKGDVDLAEETALNSIVQGFRGRHRG